MRGKPGTHLGTALVLFLVLIVFVGCTSSKSKAVFRNPNMDFGSIQSAAVMPFNNLTRDNQAGERVRDVFMTMLQATGGLYVIPHGEVARGVSRLNLERPASPTSEDVVKFAKNVNVDAVFTGTLTEYGEVRSGSTVANVVSMSLQLMEAQTGRVVWTASTTQGGVTTADRLFGGGGEPMNATIQKAIDDLLDKLFGK